MHFYQQMTYSGPKLYISKAKYELKKSLLYLLFNSLSFVYSYVTRVETDLIVDSGGKFKFRFLFIKLTRNLHIVVCLFLIVIVREKETVCVRAFLY